MTARKLYHQCLFLYPESFRQEFGDEMLDMFDECRAAQGSCRLLADVVISAVRQQIIHSSTPSRKSAPAYWEIAWSPKLATVFAGLALGAALLTGALGAAKHKAPESWAVLHTERRFGFPIALVRPSCSERQ